MNRRNFLKTTGTVATAMALYPALAARAQRLADPGLQLFTFFNVIDQDVTGTLKKIADLGYKNIESAFSKKGGYYGKKPREFASTLKDMGMTWRSHHVLGAPFKLPPNAKVPTGPDGNPISIPPMRNLKENHQELVDEAAEGGVEFLVCANTPINTLEDIKSSIAVLNKTAEAAKKAGIQFAFHNHDAEFKTVEGVIPYELFLSETDPSTMKMELDIAWAVKGGADPVALFKKHSGRFPLWHMKDLDQSRETILPVGDGTIDYKTYFKYAKESGLKYYFVEHDMPKDPFASITSSIKNVKTLLKG